MASQSDIIQDIIDAMNSHKSTRNSYITRARAVGTGDVDTEITRLEGLKNDLGTRLQNLLPRLETAEAKGTGDAGTKIIEADALYLKVDGLIDDLDTLIGNIETDQGGK